MVLRAPAIDPKILMRCTMEMHDSAVDKTGEIAQESQPKFAKNFLGGPILAPNWPARRANGLLFL